MKTTKKTAAKGKKTTTAKAKTKKKPAKKAPKAKKESTRIIGVLDRSGSMSSVAKDAIGGYNSFIDEQKKLKDEATLSAVLFDDKYEPLYDGKVLAIKDVPVLTNKEFIPRGSTGLFDAIGKSINDYKATADPKKNEKVLMVIITDGHENSSKEFTQKDIADLIAYQKKQDWQFIFLCSTEDAITVSSSLNISKGNTFQFMNTSLGNKEMYSKVSKAAASYRGMSKFDVSTSVDFDGVLKSEKLLEDEA
jgi:hypothetical protein